MRLLKLCLCFVLVGLPSLAFAEGAIDITTSAGSQVTVPASEIYRSYAELAKKRFSLYYKDGWEIAPPEVALTSLNISQGKVKGLVLMLKPIQGKDLQLPAEGSFEKGLLTWGYPYSLQRTLLPKYSRYQVVQMIPGRIHVKGIDFTDYEAVTLKLKGIDDAKFEMTINCFLEGAQTKDDTSFISSQPGNPAIVISPIINNPSPIINVASLSKYFWVLYHK
jgi:hypothetical protein